MTGKGMNPTNAPYFAFWVRDWLANERIALMMPEQKGAYIDLLAHAWVADPPCTLPDDDAALAKLSGLNGRWRRHRHILRAQFDAVDGRLRSPLLYRLYCEMVKQSEKRAGAGRKGAHARWGTKAPRAVEADSNARPVLSTTQAITSAEYERSDGNTESDIDPDTETNTLSDRVAEEMGSEDWLAQVDRAWQVACGGPLQHGEATRSLGPLVSEHGIEEVCRRLSIYLGVQKDSPQYISLPKFAATFGRWDSETCSGRGGKYDNRALEMSSQTPSPGYDVW